MSKIIEMDADNILLKTPIKHIVSHGDIEFIVKEHLDSELVESTLDRLNVDHEDMGIIYMDVPCNSFKVNLFNLKAECPKLYETFAKEY